MKKIKKLIVIALATAMLLGMTLTVNAATKCLNCGRSSVASTPNGYSCSRLDCGAPVFFYACPDCYVGWNRCSQGHMQ